MMTLAFAIERRYEPVIAADSLPGATTNGVHDFAFFDGAIGAAFFDVGFFDDVAMPANAGVGRETPMGRSRGFGAGACQPRRE